MSLLDGRGASHAQHLPLVLVAAEGGDTDDGRGGGGGDAAAPAGAATLRRVCRVLAVGPAAGVRATLRRIALVLWTDAAATATPDNATCGSSGGACGRGGRRLDREAAAALAAAAPWAGPLPGGLAEVAAPPAPIRERCSQRRCGSARRPSARSSSSCLAARPPAAWPPPARLLTRKRH